MTASPESLAEPRAPQTRMPDFFIIGHAKCGTTALYEMLRRHRDIYMPEYKEGAGKEPWFFSRDNPDPQAGNERSVDSTGRRDMSLEQYLSLFADARPDQRVGEASTSYIWSKSAAARIAEACPDAKIIAILREPASFLRSLHQQLLVNHHESEQDFAKALALDDARREGRHIPSHSYWPGALIYSDRVRYVEQLRRYHAVFPPEQVLVLIYDDFRRDNEATVRRVLRFLEVDDAAPIAVLDANPSITLRSKRLNDLRRALRAGRNPLLRGLRNTGKALTTERMREAVFYPLQRRLVYAHPGRTDEDLMNELRRRFRPEVEKLSEYLGRDLITLWRYDRLG
jgi:hypothetical protein